ncbi:MAG: hypothetical protein LBI70_00105 [Rickettsiales bacterium]|jgi:hypothetical protein|nr:hypothetical protein [Rickettsiales bacterium]
MGTKNNPKNRAGTSKNKTFDGKEVEPAVFYDFEKGISYLSAKTIKTNDIVCDSGGRPLKWKNISSK